MEAGNPIDSYTIVFLDAGGGRAGGHVVDREDGKLDVNLAKAFTDTGRRAGDLAADARRTEARVEWGARGLGAVMGLLAGLKLVQLSVRRRRKEFEIDRSRCVS